MFAMDINLSQLSAFHCLCFSWFACRQTETENRTKGDICPWSFINKERLENFLYPGYEAPSSCDNLLRPATAVVGTHRGKWGFMLPSTMHATPCS